MIGVPLVARSMKIAPTGHSFQGSYIRKAERRLTGCTVKKKAFHISEVLLGIRKEVLGDGHVDVARTLTTKGSCLAAEGNVGAAMKCFREALLISQAVVGGKHPSVVEFV